jgi:threonine dehydrogenase-like Zn-dependent dehydrogenase
MTREKRALHVALKREEWQRARMKLAHPEHAPPPDAAARKQIKPVICYPVDSLVPADISAYRKARAGWRKVITHRMKAEDFAQGFALMKQGACGKVVLDWG